MAVVSRLELNHPALGTAGGSSLHASIEALYEKIGDAVSSRWFSIADFDQAQTVDLDHNFLTDKENLQIDLMNFVGGKWVKLTAETSPAISDFTIIEKVGDEKAVLQITNDTGGDNLVFAVSVSFNPIYLSDGDVKDVDVAGAEDGQALVYNSGTKKFVPGASGDASFKIQAVSGDDLTVKAGYIILNDGREFYAGSDLIVDLSGISVDDDYYFYINLATATGTATINGRELGVVAATDVIPLTALPTEADRTQYIPIGGATRFGGTWQNLFSTAFRTHDLDQSGLEIVEVTNADSPVAMEWGKHYHTDTDGGEIVFNAPDITALSSSQRKSARCQISDKGDAAGEPSPGTWHLNKASLVPFSGQSIDKGAVDEALDLDVQGSWVTIEPDQDTSVLRTTDPIQPIENVASSDVVGYNYVENPDASSGTGSVVSSASTGSWLIERTTTPAELPEEPFKSTAFRISGSGLTVGDWVGWEIKPEGIADVHGGRMGRALANILDIAGTINGKLSIKVYNVTQSKYVGDEITIAGTDEYNPSVPLNKTEDYQVRLIAQDPNPSLIGVSGVTLENVSQSLANLGGWKTYDHGTDLTCTVSGGTNPVVNWGYFIPEKDPVSGDWFLSGRGYISRDNAATTAFTFTIPGLTWTNGSENVNGWMQDAGVADREFLLGRTSGTNDITFAPNAVSIDTCLFSFSRIKLDSKPTWADWDNTAPTITDAWYQRVKVRYVLSTNLISHPSGNPVPFDVQDTSTYETIGDWSISGSGEVPIKYTGSYLVSGMMYATGDITATSLITLEVNRNGGGWVNERSLESKNSGRTLAGSAEIYLESGDEIRLVQSGQVKNWSSTLGSASYLEISRLPDFSARSVSLPFASDTEYGVVNGGTVPGKTDGVAVSAGYIGEQLDAGLGSDVALTDSTDANLGSITLTAGVWLVYAHAFFNYAATSGNTYKYCSISETSATFDTDHMSQDTSNGVDSSTSHFRYMNLNSSTTVYAVCKTNFSAGTCSLTTSRSKFYAIRIA